MASEAFQDPSRSLWASKTGALLRSPSGCETLAALWERASPQTPTHSKPNDDGQQFRLTRDTDHIKYRAPSGRYAGKEFCVTEELGKRSKPGLELDWCDETSTNQMFDYYGEKFHLRAHGGCLAPEYVDNYSPLRGVDCDDDWTRWFIN